MLYQLTAYEVMDRLCWSFVTAETTDTGHSWTKLALSQVELPEWVRPPWDVVWLLGQSLSELAHDRGAVPARERA